MWLRTIRQRGHHEETPVVAGLHAGVAERGKAEGEKAVQDDVYAAAAGSSKTVAAAAVVVVIVVVIVVVVVAVVVVLGGSRIGSLCLRPCPRLQLGLFFFFFFFLLLLEFLVLRHGERQR